MSTLIKGSPHFSSPYSPTGETDQVPEHLFRLDPSLRALFAKTDFVRQRRMLLNMIGVTVRGLDRLGGVVPTLRDLGQRHVGYGVRPQDYETASRALLSALKDCLDDRQASIAGHKTRY